MIIQIILGLMGGLIGGMGMGGGTLLIPLLTIFLKTDQKIAQGLNLIVFIPMSIVAIIINHKNHLVEFKQTWLLALSGLVSSLCFALVANNLNNELLKKFFAIFLLILAVFQLKSTLQDFKQSHSEKSSDKSAKFVKTHENNQKN